MRWSKYGCLTSFHKSRCLHPIRVPLTLIANARIFETNWHVQLRRKSSERRDQSAAISWHLMSERFACAINVTTRKLDEKQIQLQEHVVHFTTCRGMTNLSAESYSKASFVSTHTNIHATCKSTSTRRHHIHIKSKSMIWGCHEHHLSNPWPAIYLCGLALPQRLGQVGFKYKMNL